MTAVQWLVEKLNSKYDNNDFIITYINEIEKAKEIEIYQTDNKVISFAEWLTGERAIRLMELYGEFENEFYPKEKL
jgi:disulfide oxidoreductase YuzD